MEHVLRRFQNIKDGFLLRGAGNKGKTKAKALRTELVK